MAKCEKRQINPAPPPVEYVLTLTADEAKVLCWATDGYSPDGDAGLASRVHDVLVAAGVERWKP